MPFGVEIGGNEFGVIAEKHLELKKRLREGFEKGLLPCSVSRLLEQGGVGGRQFLLGRRGPGSILGGSGGGTGEKKER